MKCQAENCARVVVQQNVTMIGKLTETSCSIRQQPFEVLYSRLLNRTCYREVPGRVHLWGLAPIANKYEAVRVNPSFAFHLVQTRVSQNNWTDIYNVRMTSTMLRANKVIFLRVFFSMLWQSCSPWKYIEHRQHKLINSSSYRGTVFIVLELSLESRETH